MSGIYGVVGHERCIRVESTLERMTQAVPMPRPHDICQQILMPEQGGFGVLVPETKANSGCQIATLPNGDACVLDGIVYARSPDGNDLLEANGAAYVLEQISSSGLDCLQHLRGSFNFAWWNAAQRRLVVANDKLGQRPLFWGSRDNTFTFGSNLAQVLAAGFVSRDIDVEGFADLVYFEYMLGERTLFTNVRMLGPGTILAFCNGNVHCERYWRIDQLEPTGTYNTQRLDELHHAFDRAVRRAIRSDITCTVGLTGGLDSRCILASAMAQHLPFVAHTSGQATSTDVVLGQELASMTATEHHVELLASDRAGHYLVPMVLHQNALVATLHDHPCQLFDAAPIFDAEVLGIGGEFVRSFWLTRKNNTISSIADAQAFAQRRLLGQQKLEAFKPIWRREWQQIGEYTPRRHINDRIGEYALQDEPASALDFFYLDERCRKFLNKAILVARTHEEVYLPFLDHEWVEAIAHVPIAERLKHRIQVDLIRRTNPKLLDVPYAKTMIPFSTPRWQEWAINKMRKAKAKVTRLLGASSAIRTTEAHDYPTWSRTIMRNMLTQRLYNPRAAFREYLEWGALQPLLDQHFAGQTNKTSLVAALTVFEIAHELWA